MTTNTIALSAPRILPLVFASVLGLALLTISGMAQSSALHDAAHDQRHAMAFPCH